MRPLPFAWPYWPVFWLVFLWAFSPEFKIVRNAQKSTAANRDSADAGSLRVIAVGMWGASAIAFPLAWVQTFKFPAALGPAMFVLGTALLVAGSLLRRHCWRQLGESFTGDVRARSDQQVVTAGAYAWLRHPSYTAGILMNAGIGVALGSWGSTLVFVIASFAVYAYRISVEERALVAAIGDPYREFMRTRRRLVPFIY